MPFKKKSIIDEGAVPSAPNGDNFDNTETLPIPTPIPSMESVEPVEPVIEPEVTPEPTKPDEVVVQETPVKAVGNDSIPTLIGKTLTSKFGIDAAFSVMGTQAAAAVVRELPSSFNLIRTSIDASRLDVDNGPVIYVSDVDGYLTSFNVNSYFRNKGARLIYIGDIDSVNDLIGVLEAATTRVMHRHKIVRLDLSKTTIPGATAALLASYKDSYLVRGGGSIVYWICNSSDTFTFTMIDLMSVKSITQNQVLQGEYGRVIDVDEM